MAWTPVATGAAKLVSTTNAYQSIRPADGPYWIQDGVTDWPKCWADYGGTAYATKLGGPNGFLLGNGGGHSSSNCNAVMGMNLDYTSGPTWVLLTNPSTATSPNQGHVGSGRRSYGWNGTYCEYGDGQPGSMHPYCSLQWLPNTYQPRRLPAARLGWLLRPHSAAVQREFSNNTTAAHILAVNSFSDRTQNKWYRLTDTVPGSWSGGAGISTSLDLSRMQVFVRWSVTSVGHSGIDLLARTSARHFPANDALFSLPGESPDSRTQLYIPAPHDVHVLMQFDASGAAKIFYRAGGDTSIGWLPVTLGGTAIPNPGGSVVIRGDYVSHIDRLCIFPSGSSTNTYYELTVPTPKSSPWVATQRSFSGSALPWFPSPPILSSHDGRHTRYCPEIKQFVSTMGSAHNDNLWVMRPVGVT